jgi:hypothetical protein
MTLCAFVLTMQAPAVQQRYSSALASLCLLGWHQHTLQQRQDPHSRLRLRQQLRARSAGCCSTLQQWRRDWVLRSAFGGWRCLVQRGTSHYRYEKLASGLQIVPLAQAKPAAQGYTRLTLVHQTPPPPPPPLSPRFRSVSPATW